MKVVNPSITAKMDPPKTPIDFKGTRCEAPRQTTKTDLKKRHTAV